MISEFRNVSGHPESGIALCHDRPLNGSGRRGAYRRIGSRVWGEQT